MCLLCNGCDALHGDIARERGMKEAKFNDKLGAMAGCTVQLLLNTILDHEKENKHGICGDAWFGSVNTANEFGICGHEGVFQVKQYHNLFPKEFIEE
jgi:hypothetical protein